jgi:hypothetical protein
VIDSAGDEYDAGGFARKRGHGERLSAGYQRPCEVFGASASSAFYRADVLRAVGGFPADFGAYFEDVDLAFRLNRAGYRVRYEPAARVDHEHPSSTAAWLRRRAVYGTGAAPLAARHGRAVAPVVVSPWSAAALGLAAGGGRAGRVLAAAVLGDATVRLARRLAGPGRRAPYGLAAALVLRGTAAAGRTLARSATRHHWPLTAAAAVVSRRARRVVLSVSVADAVLAWWPHRSEVDLARFAAARRLEDLAYGAGLWAGALRRRDPAALLPAAPPRV